MSNVKIYVLTCDRCGKKGPGGSDCAEAGEKAKEAGWEAGLGALCPDCKKKKRETK